MVTPIRINKGAGLQIRIYLEFLRGRISKKRLEHSIRVGRVSAAIARTYGLDPLEAWYAGLLHDCAREVPLDELKAYSLREGLDFDPFEMEKPVLLHGKVGASLLENNFLHLSADVIRAVSVHVRGTEVMGPLDKIVFIADFIEPGRSYFHPGLQDWTAFESLDELYERVERTISLYYKKKKDNKERSRKG